MPDFVFNNSDQRVLLNHQGQLVVDIPEVPRSREALIRALFSQDGWTYQVLQQFDRAHLKAKISNARLSKEYIFHLFHGDIRKEDPNRNRAEFKIQLNNRDPRTVAHEMTLILGFYTYKENDAIGDAIIGAWPVEMDKNYLQNPSLRINMQNNLALAKTNGLHIDNESGKRLVAFKPGSIFNYLDNYNLFHQAAASAQEVENELDQQLNEEVSRDAFTSNQEIRYSGAKPKVATKIVKGQRVYPRNKQTSVNALIKARCRCEIDQDHPSFLRRNSNELYMEPHHLIPTCFHDRFNVSLDIEENIVSLCSNCHNQLHYGQDIVPLITQLFELRRDVLASAGINITLAELLSMYNHH